MLSEYVV